MTFEESLALDPELDLVIKRHVPVSPARVWRAWTEPEQLKKWWCPRPWRTTVAELDVRPGGKFYTVMNGPDGEVQPNLGCYLEVVPERRLVWTDFLLPGFRPAGKGFLVGVLHVEPDGTGGCHYTAISRHADPATAKQHVEMGFYEGWGTVTDQLVELTQTM